MRLIAQCAISCLFLFTTAGAEAACPSHAEPYKVTTQRNEKTVHCRCVTGFVGNSAGQCVKAADLFGLRDSVASPAQNPCISGVSVKTKNFYHYLVFSRNKQKRCPGGMTIRVCIWDAGSYIGPRSTTKSDPLELNFGYLAQQSTKNLKYYWTTNGSDCQVRSKAKPLPQS